jgi:hypothetical protein
MPLRHIPMRHPIFAALLATLAASPGLAADLSTEIGQNGLFATEARLAALPFPSDADRFALGGVHFLRTIETALQNRWRSGMHDPTGMLPVLRLPMGDNPDAGTFDPSSVATLFRDMITGMETARAPLEAIPDGADFTVEIALDDLWFDINQNDQRDAGEGLVDVAGSLLLGQRRVPGTPASPAPVIRFDAADAAWLAAYTHLLTGISELVLAYDPTASLTKVQTANAAMADLSPLVPRATLFPNEAQVVDALYVMIDALNQMPDAVRTASARDHFLHMIRENRHFWARVAAETDNDHEWLPNDAQTSALGIMVPQGMGDRWLAVLADGEALLNGQVLVPYWRLGDGGGINVGKMFTDPAPIDLIGWIQGTDAVAYMDQGPMISGENWRMFERLVGGEAMLFSIFLN